MAKRKIMTHYMSAGISEADPGIYTENAKNYWLLQDDIEVIGWQQSLKAYWTFGMNGVIDCYGEISQAPTMTKDGAIARMRIGAGTDPIGASGGAGVGNPYGNEQTFLPAGESISLKEGEYLNLHVQVESPEANPRMDYSVLIFYRVVGS